MVRGKTQSSNNCLTPLVNNRNIFPKLKGQNNYFPVDYSPASRNNDTSHGTSPRD